MGLNHKMMIKSSFQDEDSQKLIFLSSIFKSNITRNSDQLKLHKLVFFILILCSLATTCFVHSQQQQLQHVRQPIALRSVDTVCPDSSLVETVDNYRAVDSLHLICLTKSIRPLSSSPPVASPIVSGGQNYQKIFYPGTDTTRWVNDNNNYDTLRLVHTISLSVIELKHGKNYVGQVRDKTTLYNYIVSEQIITTPTNLNYEKQQFQTPSLAHFVDRGGHLHIIIAEPYHINGTSIVSLDDQGQPLTGESQTINSHYVNHVRVWRTDINYNWHLAIVNRPSLSPPSPAYAYNQHSNQYQYIDLYVWRLSYFDRYFTIPISSSLHVTDIEPFIINGQDFLSISTRDHNYLNSYNYNNYQVQNQPSTYQAQNRGVQNQGQGQSLNYLIQTHGIENGQAQYYNHNQIRTNRSVVGVEPVLRENYVDSLIYRLDISTGYLIWNLYQRLPTIRAHQFHAFSIIDQQATLQQHYLALVGQLSTSQIVTNANLQNYHQQHNSTKSSSGVHILKYFGDKFMRTHYIETKNEAIQIETLNLSPMSPSTNIELATTATILIAILTNSKTIEFYSFDGLTISSLSSQQDASGWPITSSMGDNNHLTEPRINLFTMDVYSSEKSPLLVHQPMLIMTLNSNRNQVITTTGSDRIINNSGNLYEIMLNVTSIITTQTFNVPQILLKPQPLFFQQKQQYHQQPNQQQQQPILQQYVQNPPYNPYQQQYGQNLTYAQGQGHGFFIQDHQKINEHEQMLNWCHAQLELIANDNFEMLKSQIESIPTRDNQQRIPIEIHGDLEINSDLHVEQYLSTQQIIEEQQQKQIFNPKDWPHDTQFASFELNQLWEDIKQLKKTIDAILVDDGTPQDVYLPLQIDSLQADCFPTISTGSNIPNSGPMKLSSCPYVEQLNTLILNGRNVSDLSRRGFIDNHGMIFDRPVRFEHLILTGSTQIHRGIDNIIIDDIVFKKGPSTGPIVSEKVFNDKLVFNAHLNANFINGHRIDDSSVLTKTRDQIIENNLHIGHIFIDHSMPPTNNNIYKQNMMIESNSARIDFLNGINLGNYLNSLVTKTSNITIRGPVEFDQLYLDGPLLMHANARLAGLDIEDVYANTLWTHGNQIIPAPMHFEIIQMGSNANILTNNNSTINGVVFKRKNIVTLDDEKIIFNRPVVFHSNIYANSVYMNHSLNGLSIQKNPITQRMELPILYKFGDQILTGSKVFNQIYLNNHSYVRNDNINGNLNLTELSQLLSTTTYKYQNNSSNNVMRFAHVKLEGNIDIQSQVAFEVLPNGRVNGVDLNELCKLSHTYNEDQYNNLYFQDFVKFKNLKCNKINDINYDNLTTMFMVKNQPQIIKNNLILQNGVKFENQLTISSTLNQQPITSLSSLIMQTINETVSGFKEIRGDLHVDELFVNQINDINMNDIIYLRPTPSSFSSPDNNYVYAQQNQSAAVGARNNYYNQARRLNMSQKTTQYIDGHLEFENVDFDGPVTVGQDLNAITYNQINLTDLFTNTLDYDSYQTIQSHVKVNTLSIAPNSNLATKSINNIDLRAIYDDAVVRDSPQTIWAPKIFTGPVSVDQMIFARDIDGVTDQDLRHNWVLQGVDQVIYGDFEFNHDLSIKKDLNVRSGVINDYNINSLASSLLMNLPEVKLRVTGSGPVTFRDVSVEELVVGGKIQGIDLSRQAIHASRLVNETGKPITFGGPHYFVNGFAFGRELNVSGRMFGIDVRELCLPPASIPSQIKPVQTPLKLYPYPGPYISPEHTMKPFTYNLPRPEQPKLIMGSQRPQYYLPRQPPPPQRPPQSRPGPPPPTPPPSPFWQLPVDYPRQVVAAHNLSYPLLPRPPPPTTHFPSSPVTPSWQQQQQQQAWKSLQEQHQIWLKQREDWETWRTYWQRQQQIQTTPQPTLPLQPQRVASSGVRGQIWWSPITQIQQQHQIPPPQYQKQVPPTPYYPSPTSPLSPTQQVIHQVPTPLPVHLQQVPVQPIQKPTQPPVMNLVAPQPKPLINFVHITRHPHDCILIDSSSPVQYIRGEKHFKTFIADGPITINGLVNNVDLPSLKGRYLSKSKPQIINVPVEFQQRVDIVSGPLIVNGNISTWLINDVEVNQLKKNSLKLTGDQDIWSPVIFEDKVEFMTDIDVVNSINQVRFTDIARGRARAAAAATTQVVSNPRQSGGAAIYQPQIKTKSSPNLLAHVQYVPEHLKSPFGGPNQVMVTHPRLPIWLDLTRSLSHPQQNISYNYGQKPALNSALYYKPVSQQLHNSYQNLTSVPHVVNASANSYWSDKSLLFANLSDLENFARMQAQQLDALTYKVYQQLSLPMYYSVIQPNPKLGPVLHATYNPYTSDGGSTHLFVRSIEAPGEPCRLLGQSVSVLAQRQGHSYAAASSRSSSLPSKFIQESKITETVNPTLFDSVHTKRHQYLFVVNPAVQLFNNFSSVLQVFHWDPHQSRYELFQQINLVASYPIDLKAFTSHRADLACFVLATTGGATINFYNAAYSQSGSGAIYGIPQVFCQLGIGSSFELTASPIVGGVSKVDVITSTETYDTVLMATLSQNDNGRLASMDLWSFSLTTRTYEHLDRRSIVRPYALHLFVDYSTDTILPVSSVYHNQNYTSSKPPVEPKIFVVMSEGITTKDTVNSITRLYQLTSSSPPNHRFPGGSTGNHQLALKEIQQIIDYQVWDIQSLILANGQSLLFLKTSDSISIYRPTPRSNDHYSCGHYSLHQRLATNGANKMIVFGDRSLYHDKEIAPGLFKSDHFVVLSKDFCERQQFDTTILRSVT